MSADPDDARDESTRNRLLGRLDRMVDAGRVTDGEAQRLRAAADPAELKAAIGAIRARHAGSKLDAAVARGGLSRSEADDLLKRLRGGGHSASLRGQVRAATAADDRRSRSTGSAPARDARAGVAS